MKSDMGLAHYRLSVNRITIFFCFYFILEYQYFILINNVVLVSGVQPSDSVLHIPVSSLFQILFPFTLLQNIEQSSLCYTVGPCWLCVLNIAVCTCQSQTPNLSFPPLPASRITIMTSDSSCTAHPGPRRLE